MGWGAPTWEKKKEREGGPDSFISASPGGWGCWSLSGAFVLLLANQTPLGALGASATCRELLGPTLCSVILPGTRFSARLCPEVTVPLLSRAGSFPGSGWC